MKILDIKNAEGRPIVGNFKSPFINASKFIAFTLQPILEKTPTYIKNSYNLINLLKNIKFNSELPIYLITGDVKEMYPSIPLKEVYKMVEKYFHNIHNNEFLSEKQYFRILGFVLFRNVLEFNEEYYLQIDGLPMGSACSPQLASLFLWNLEEKIPSEFLKYILIWKRFIDDIFVLWNGPKEILEEFKQWYNSLHKNIKILWNVNENNINYLDIIVYVDGLNFGVKTFQKPFNVYGYIPFNSFHPESVKKGFIKSEIIRYLRTNTKEKDYLDICFLFFRRLRTRGYPDNFLKRIFAKFKFQDKENIIRKKSCKDNPLVIKLPYEELFFDLNTKYLLILKVGVILLKNSNYLGLLLLGLIMLILGIF